MKILVLGGTRFFGKELVHRLLEKGHKVTVATRGNTADPFKGQTEHVRVDRFSEASMTEAFNNTKWDVIYDQICYGPDEAALACQLFDGNVGKYIFTSSMAVYEGYRETPLLETAFDPYTYSVEATGDVDYAEGKRLAESVFFQKAQFPVVAVRLPIVMGEEDYTERLLFHLEHIKEEKPFYVPNLESKMSYISGTEASAFLAWLSKSNLQGPVNVCADGEIAIGDLITLVEKVVGKKAVFQNTSNNPSPYGTPGSKIMSTNKAKEAGYSFTNLHDWLPKLIENLN